MVISSVSQNALQLSQTYENFQNAFSTSISSKLKSKLKSQCDLEGLKSFENI